MTAACRNFSNLLSVASYIYNRMAAPHETRPGHARGSEYLEDHLELLRCYYDFIRPHRGLKFGKQFKTPAMQAGLAARRLSFWEVFMGVVRRFIRVIVAIDFRPWRGRMRTPSLAA